MNMSAESTLYTVGHSNHGMATFLGLLQTHSIHVVVDVRTTPYSRHAKQFDGSNLKKGLESAGIKYLYLGKELGGRPRSDSYYDRDGYARYDLIAQSNEFRNGVSRLQSGLREFRVAVMCSEEDPSGCHRRLLIGRVVAEQGKVAICHIRGDGSVQAEEELVASEGNTETEGRQLALLDLHKEETWRSAKPIRSVSQSDERTSSLEH